MLRETLDELCDDWRYSRYCDAPEVEYFLGVLGAVYHELAQCRECLDALEERGEEQ